MIIAITAIYFSLHRLTQKTFKGGWHVCSVSHYVARRIEAALIVSLIASYLKRTQRGDGLV